MLYGVMFAKGAWTKMEILAAHMQTLMGLDFNDREDARLINNLVEIFQMSGHQSKMRLKEMDRLKSAVYDFEYLTNFMHEDGCKHYYITSPVLHISQKLKLPEPIDLQLLGELPNEKRQLNFSDRFIRYEKVDTLIQVLSAVGSGKNTEARYSFFMVDTEDKKVTRMQEELAFNDSDEEALSFEAKSQKQFFQLMLFMRFAQVQEIFLKPGSKHGHKKDADNLMNQESFPMTIVNTNWNKTIRTEGFPVEGHLRLQPYGPGKEDKKLIYIRPFEKKGYNLNAGKKKDEDNPGKKI